MSHRDLHRTGRTGRNRRLRNASMAVFRPMEGTLTALQEVGIDLHEALQAYFLLTNFTMGQVS